MVVAMCWSVLVGSRSDVVVDVSEESGAGTVFSCSFRILIEDKANNS